LMAMFVAFTTELLLRIPTLLYVSVT
jgi:hypothetical protein